MSTTPTKGMDKIIKECSMPVTQGCGCDEEEIVNILTLQVPHATHQSIIQSNILAIVLTLMALRSGVNFLMMCVVQYQLPPSGKSSKLTCMQKPIRHSFPCHPCVSLV